MKNLIWKTDRIYSDEHLVLWMAFSNSLSLRDWRKSTSFTVFEDETKWRTSLNIQQRRVESIADILSLS